MDLGPNTRGQFPFRVLPGFPSAGPLRKVTNGTLVPLSSLALPKPTTPSTRWNIPEGATPLRGGYRVCRHKQVLSCRFNFSHAHQ